MIVSYNSLDRFEKPKLALCNPGARIDSNGCLTNCLGYLTDYDSEEIVFNFNSTSDLNFRVYKVEHDDSERNAHAAFLYRAIKNKRLVFVDNIGFFVISDITIGFDGHTDYIDVTAHSAESEIEQKKIPYIEDGTYPFTTQPTSETTGLIDTLIALLPIWSIGTIDHAVAERWRTFEDVSVDANVLSFMLQDMQDAYECIFVFDIINRVINVYDQHNYVRMTSIHLTKDDMIDTLNIEENGGDVYTAISVIGGENVTIGAVNPLGINTIYDFSYYIDWMSDSLAAKVRTWQALVANKEQEYYNLSLQYYTKLGECSTASHSVQQLQTQITAYRRLRDNIVAGSSGYALNEYNKVIQENGGTAVPITENIQSMLDQIDALIIQCQSQIDELNGDLDDANAELDELETSIKAIVDEVSFETYFTQEEFEELYYYIFEGSYSDEYVIITETMTPLEQFEQMKTLYDRAKSQLARICKPTQQFTIDAENFVFAKEFERWSEELETGCLINVELDDDDVAQLFLTNITINYDDHALSMTFGNRFNKYDPKTLFENVLGGINKSANSISYLKDTVYPIKSGQFNKMREQIQASRDLTMDAALSSTNQEVTIDGSGYTGREKISEDEYDPRQVKLTGKSLVFTDDAWESCKVAIGEIMLGDGSTTYGINAETIIGDLIIGNQLVIKDNDGNDLFTIIDGKIASEVDSIDARLKDTIVDTAYTYCVRDFGVSPNASDADWSSTFPVSWGDGQRVWRKTVVTHDSGETEIKAIEDITGATGKDGESGISVVRVWYEYTISGSTEVITPIIYPSTGTIVGSRIYPSISIDWSETPPEYVEDHYYWRRVGTEYSDGTIVYSDPYVDTLLSRVWIETTRNSTNIEQLDSRITLTASSVSSNVEEIRRLDGKIDQKELELTEKIASINIDAEAITAQVTETVRDEFGEDIKYAKTWLDENGLHVKTSESTTESFIDGTGLEVREVTEDEHGNEVIKTVMKAKDGEVEAARFKATELFTYDSGQGYLSTMKVYYSSADQEHGIGWYWINTNATNEEGSGS